MSLTCPPPVPPPHKHTDVKADLPTPNLPVVDKIVGGVQSFTKSFLPKCPANTVLDITLMRTLTNPCKACAPGTVAKENDARCGVCGKGRCVPLNGFSGFLCPLLGQLLPAAAQQLALHSTQCTHT